jgi:DNA polymerase-1
VTASGSRRLAAEREAINAPIQGTSADLIKMAMNRLFAELQGGGYAAKMILQVHDELLLEVPDDELEEVRALVVRVMEGVDTSLSVPLDVEASVGRNWDEMK